MFLCVSLACHLRLSQQMLSTDNSSHGTGGGGGCSGDGIAVSPPSSSPSLSPSPLSSQHPPPPPVLRLLWRQSPSSSASSLSSSSSTMHQQRLSHLLKWLLLEIYEIVVHHSTKMKRLVCFEYGIALRQGMVLVLLFIAKKGTRLCSF